MNCRAAAFFLSGLSALAVAVPARGQCPNQPTTPPRAVDPPGRDLFIPYVRTPGATAQAELRTLQQLRILAEMNKLTVELVKRRSDRDKVQADTAQLVQRLKKLAKQLQEQEW